MKRHWIFAAAILLFAAALGAGPAAAGAFDGTWQFDPSRTEDSNPPRVTFTPITNGISIRIDEELPWAAYFDGKDYPFSAGNRIAVSRVNADTLAWITRRKGRLLSRSTLTVDPDGRRAVTVVEEGCARGVCKSILVNTRVGSGPVRGDAFIGTWQQDPSQDRYDPPLTYSLKVFGNTLDFMTNGRRIVRAKFDGKQYEQIASDATIQLKQDGENTIEMIQNDPYGRPARSLWQVNGNELMITFIAGGADRKPLRRIHYFARVE